MGIRRPSAFFVTFALISSILAVAPSGASATASQSASTRLRHDASGLSITSHPDGRPSFVIGKIPFSKFTSSSNAAGRARDFWKTYGRVLEVTDAGTQLHLVRSTTDAQGATHLKYEERYRGLTVAGRQLSLHLKGSSVTGVNGDFVGGINVPTSPHITGAQAQARAGGRYAMSGGVVSKAKPQLLVYVDKTEHQHLAWKVSTITSRPFNVWVSFVDAGDGHVIDSYSALRNVARNVYSDENNCDTTDITTCSLPGTGVRLDGDGSASDGDTDNVYDTSTAVWNYYSTNFSRNSYDDGSSPLNSTVHFGTDFLNSFWCPTDCLSAFAAHGSEQAVFGDGTSSAVSSLASDPDVVAHELSHGFNEYSVGSGGFYYLGQSGALDESYADSFSALINDHWQLGSASWVGGGNDWLRNLADPSTDHDLDGNALDDPASMSEFKTSAEDQAEVHANSLIPSHAVYLLSDDVSYGIGKTKTAQILYHAIFDYLTPFSDFRDNTIALYLAARDIYGEDSTEEKAVINAQAAVGLAVPPDLVNPVGFERLKGGDLTTVDWTGNGTEGRSYVVEYSTAGSTTTYSQPFEGTSLPSGFSHLGSDVSWGSTTSDKFAGSRSVKAGTLPGTSGRSSLTFTRTLTDIGSVTFAYRVSSEAGLGVFSFYIDGQAILADSGYPDVKAWSTVSIPLGPGTHTFTWLYEKFDTDVGPYGSDTAWLDSLSITAAPTLNWSNVATTPADVHSADWTPPATSGSNYRVRLRVNGMGAGIGETISEPFTVDATGPSSSITSALSLWQLGLTSANFGTGKFSIPVSISDPLSGIDTYDVKWKYGYPDAGGSFVGGTPNPLIQGETSTLPTTFAASFPTTLTGFEGGTACFAARAMDGVGNQGSYSSYRCTAAPYHALDLIRTAGTWTSGTGSGYYMNAYMQSTRQGAYIRTSTWRARRIVLVATKCSTCGTVEVFRGSTLLARISLHSSSTHKRQLITVKTYSSLQASAIYKVRIYSSGQLVRLEGLGLSLA